MSFQDSASITALFENKGTVKKPTPRYLPPLMPSVARQTGGKYMPISSPNMAANIENAEIPQQMPAIDYVLVYSSTDRDLETPRTLFHQAILNDGLQTETVESGSKVFMKIYCPFDRMACEAERIKLEMPLKGCDITPSEPKCFRTLQKTLTTDDEVDFVSAPFETSKLHLYEGGENKATFFRSSLRIFLVHQILINLDIKDQLRTNSEEDDIISKRGLLYLLMKNAYVDSFVLHEMSGDDPLYKSIKDESLEQYYLQIPKLPEDSRRDMNRTWTKFLRFQPLWKIRNYFGEKIAFYFAWQGTFVTVLWLPALMGLGIFFYGINNSIHTAVLNSTHVEVTPHGTSTPNTTAAGPQISLKQTATDMLQVVQRAFDNNATPFFSLIICLWGFMFLEIWKRNNYTLAYQWDVNNYEHSEPDRPEFFGTDQKPDPITGELAWIYPLGKRIKKYFVSGVTSALLVGVVFLSVSLVIAYKVLVRHELQCTEDDSTEIKCLLFATVTPALLNAGSIMLLGLIYSRIAFKLTNWENHRTQSEFNDALIIKLFAFQFANTYASLFYIAFFRPLEHGLQDNGVFGWGVEYRDTCTHESQRCMGLLSFQVLVLMVMKPFPKMFKDIIWPWMTGVFRRFRLKWKRRSAVAANEANGASSAEDGEFRFLLREYYKPKTEDFTMGEYTEKVIQFGYIIMFAASIPLAPLLALIINLFDMRVDARRLLWWNRRPIAFIASDIGMWFPILRFVNFCGVVSNAFLIAYTSNFCTEFLMPNKCTAKERLIMVVAFEHFVFLIMYLINVLVPDIPSNIRLAQRRERYQVAKILEKGMVPVGGRRTSRPPSAASSVPYPPLNEGPRYPEESSVPGHLPGSPVE